jgi:hypothetical protein
MPSVTFSFRPQVSADKRKEVLESISGWTSVLTAALLKPDAKNEEIQRMAFATIAEAAEVERLVKRLTDLPEIEHASVPARRKLL